jgi:hypothetical protein
MAFIATFGKILFYCFAQSFSSYAAIVNVIIMNGIMLYFILPNVITLNVVAPGFFISL